ncbi:sensor histidine kinase [Rhizobium sp. RAF56]|uniref:sensor histidine kinase n=1 Tax=Rhizobium sp. RAF56 TaxID=3233062 RepID=UPI003F99CF37
MILAVGAIILFGIVLSAFYVAQRAADEADNAVAANRLNIRVLRLLNAAQGAETGQRGYLLTGEERYLQPYTASSATVTSEADAIGPLLLTLGVPQASVDELRNVLTQKLEEMQRTIELRKSGDAAAAVALVKTGRGLALMDEVRDLMDDIQQRGIQNSTGHVAALRSTTGWLSVVIAVSAALLALLAGGAVKLVYDHAAELEAAQRQLSRANETLEEMVDLRTQSLRRANTELQTYAYIVSHDLRAPLVNIMGFTEELDRAAAIFRSYLTRTRADPSKPDDKTVVEAVETDIPEALGFIRASMRRMDNLINQVLIMARAGNRELQAERIRLSELVEECCTTLKHRIDERGVSIDVAGGLPEVHSDRAALQQIVANLLDNAIKYLDPSRVGMIAIKGWRAGTHAILEVRDNGRGIAPGDQERIFELFRRSGRQDQPGDGVGLAHVRALTRRLGGDVTVRSALGEGTTFQVAIAVDLTRMKKDEMA